MANQTKPQQCKVGASMAGDYFEHAVAECPECEAYEAERAARPVLSGTCATCANRLGSGSCEVDVQDPKGEPIDRAIVQNWKNRDTFGCTEWTSNTEGTAS